MFLICSSHCYICHAVSDPHLSHPPHFIDNCTLMQATSIQSFTLQLNSQLSEAVCLLTEHAILSTESRSAFRVYLVCLSSMSKPPNKTQAYQLKVDAAPVKRKKKKKGRNRYLGD
ncbi:hypothetical protein BD560DRAFT_490711 [Blakeslea trispora]|nr:hypothetical protein BD560DRAFT_490711 [Blakeslea trispora]